MDKIGKISQKWELASFPIIWQPRASYSFKSANTGRWKTFPNNSRTFQERFRIFQEQITITEIVFSKTRRSKQTKDLNLTGKSASWKRSYIKNIEIKSNSRTILKKWPFFKYISCTKKIPEHFEEFKSRWPPFIIFLLWMHLQNTYLRSGTFFYQIDSNRKGALT